MSIFRKIRSILNAKAGRRASFEAIAKMMIGKTFLQVQYLSISVASWVEYAKENTEILTELPNIKELSIVRGYDVYKVGEAVPRLYPFDSSYVREMVRHSLFGRLSPSDLDEPTSTPVEIVERYFRQIHKDNPGLRCPTIDFKRLFGYNRRPGL
jgi:hypothetical protein